MKYLSRNRTFDMAKSVTRPKNKDPKQILKELQSLDSSSSDITTYKSKRYFRDPRKSALLKELYEYKCQICGIRITDDKNNPYIETHHIQRRSQGGVDEPRNMLVLCPNHHTMFGLGSAKIDVSTKKVYINNKEVDWTNKHI